MGHSWEVEGCCLPGLTSISTVDDINPALTHNKEHTRIPMV